MAVSRSLRLSILCLVLLWQWPEAAEAQGVAPGTSSEARQRYDAAFAETMRAPADLDVLFRFAAVATEVGDLEGAVSALERMLLVNPDLPRVRLELGVLYFRLGAWEAARTYLVSALRSPALPADVRRKAEQYLAEIETRASPSSLAGEVFVGWRYQSNANLGPATSRVLLFGQPANLNQAALGTADWGVVTSGQLRHRWDFGRQDSAALETQLAVYANRQFQLSAANVALLDLTTGPRFQVLEGVAEDVSLRPFLTGGYVWVNDTPYYGSWGGGLESGAKLLDNLRNETVFVFRRQDNQDTSYLPTNSQYRGTSLTLNTLFQLELGATLSLFALASIQRFQADLAPWQSYGLFGLGGGFSVRFVDPLLRTGLPWTLSFSATEQWWRYDEPDAIVDPFGWRTQNDTILTIALAVPFDARTTVALSAGRFVRGASLPNYAFENNSVMAGVSWRF